MHAIVGNIWLLEEWGILGYIVHNIVLVFRVIINPLPVFTGGDYSLPLRPSVCPSVCLSHFSFPHFFSLCVWGIIWNLLNSFKMSNYRSSLHFGSVWLTYFREIIFYSNFLMFGFDILHNSALFSQFPQTGRGRVLLMQYSQNACFV